MNTNLRTLVARVSRAPKVRQLSNDAPVNQRPAAMQANRAANRGVVALP